jgi:predicted dehydrogenase
MRDHAIVPRYIEASRVAPFPFRSTDVGVVLDLMIHDIDIVLHLAGSPAKSVEAIGVPVLMTTEDIANARITFENGCVASLTASRVATKSERKVRVFSKDSYLVLDFGRREGYLYRKQSDFTQRKVEEFIGQAVAGGKSTLADLQGKVFTDLLTMERLTIPEGDALTEEAGLVRCVRARAPAVSGARAGGGQRRLDVLAAIGLRAAGRPARRRRDERSSAAAPPLASAVSRPQRRMLGGRARGRVARCASLPDAEARTGRERGRHLPTSPSGAARRAFTTATAPAVGTRR